MTAIVITVGVGAAILMGFFLVYYLGNVANTMYEVRVKIVKDVEKKNKELQDSVDKEMGQRSSFIRNETSEELRKFRDAMRDEMNDSLQEVRSAMERLQMDVAQLQTDIQSAEEARPRLRRATVSREPSPEEVAIASGSGGSPVPPPNLPGPDGAGMPMMGASAEPDADVPAEPRISSVRKRRAEAEEASRAARTRPAEKSGPAKPKKEERRKSSGVFEEFPD